jgi:hypothetical protein
MIFKFNRAVARATFLFTAAALAPSPALAQKASECTKIAICYCVTGATKPAIEKNIAYFREQIAAQRKLGKAIGYISLPLSSAGGGVYHINAEVAASVKAAVEKRFGADQVWMLNPAVPDSDIPNGGGADYMLMWTTILEGRDGLGEDFDFAYFVGPQDFARFMGLTGTNDMATIEAYFDTRVKTDAELQKAVQKGLTKAAFRNYYALKASTSISKGAHDEWNIVRALNERRRADSRLGIGNQITMMFDGRGVSPADFETPTSEGYTGKCSN